MCAMILTWSLSHCSVALHANFSRRSSRTQFQKLHLTIFGREITRLRCMFRQTLCSIRILILSTFSPSHKYADFVSWLALVGCVLIIKNAQLKADIGCESVVRWKIAVIAHLLSLARTHHYRASRCGSHLQNYAHFICSGKHFLRCHVLFECFNSLFDLRVTTFASSTFEYRYSFKMQPKKDSNSFYVIMRINAYESGLDLISKQWSCSGRVRRTYSHKVFQASCKSTHQTLSRRMCTAC